MFPIGPTNRLLGTFTGIKVPGRSHNLSSHLCFETDAHPYTLRTRDARPYSYVISCGVAARTRPLQCKTYRNTLKISRRPSAYLSAPSVNTDAQECCFIPLFLHPPVFLGDTASAYRSGPLNNRGWYEKTQPE